MIKHRKIEALLLSGEEANIDLAFELAKSQKVSLNPILKKMKAFADFLAKVCHFRLNYEQVEDLPKLMARQQRFRIDNRIFKILEEPVPTLMDHFEFFPNLEVFELAGIGLEELPSSIGSCHKLRKLSLPSNNLRSLPKTIQSLAHLKGLDLSDNPLNEIPSVIFACRSLEELYLNQSAIHQLEEEIAELSELKYLNLSVNILHKLPKGITKLSKLESLVVSDCHLESIPSAIGDLKKLKTLNLYKNKIGELPASFSTLEALENCVLLDNPIEFLPANLDQLELDNLSVSNFPKGLGHLKELKSLRLEVKAAYPLDWAKIICQLKSLEYLQINFNGKNEEVLEQFPIELTELHQLEELSITGLKIKSFPVELENWSRLKKLEVFHTELENISSWRRKIQQLLPNCMVILT